MTAAGKVDRAPRRQVDKVDKVEERRRELADAALQTLSELGYARTSLREIAQNSAFSHGVLHYYFRDKVDLITYCVRQYKARCVLRYDGIVLTASTPAGLAEGFADALVATLVEEAHLHRLWYDLRSQALFEESLRDDVLDIDATLEQMVWRVVARLGELAERPIPTAPSMTYALLDGLFQQALLRHLAGAASATADLHRQVLQLLGQLVPEAARREPTPGTRPERPASA